MKRQASEADGVEPDLEERVRKLERAIAARDEFINVAAHDLKTPLSAMQLHAQMLLRSAKKGDPIPSDKLVPKLETIRRQVTKLTQLIDDLLDVSRITRGRIDLDTQPTDLRAVLDEVVEERRKEAERAGSRVDVDAPESTSGDWDPRRLRQIVDHLLVNAIKFGGGGPIALRVDDRDGRVRFSVLDQGPGIATEDQARIFEQFERGAGGGEPDQLGLGLGLWIVREVVQAMNGSIELQSAPGQGARFVVELPRRRS